MPTGSTITLPREVVVSLLVLTGLLACLFLAGLVYFIQRRYQCMPFGPGPRESSKSLPPSLDSLEKQPSQIQNSLQLSTAPLPPAGKASRSKLRTSSTQMKSKSNSRFSFSTSWPPKIWFSKKYRKSTSESDPSMNPSVRSPANQYTSNYPFLSNYSSQHTSFPSLPRLNLTMSSSLSPPRNLDYSPMVEPGSLCQPSSLTTSVDHIDLVGDPVSSSHEARSIPSIRGTPPSITPSTFRLLLPNGEEIRKSGNSTALFPQLHAFPPEPVMSAHTLPMSNPLFLALHDPPRFPGLSSAINEEEGEDEAHLIEGSRLNLAKLELPGPTHRAGTSHSFRVW
jgi:hypothetical protein